MKTFNSLINIKEYNNTYNILIFKNGIYLDFLYDKIFGDCDCCEKPDINKEYKPIFGVQTMSESSIFTTSSRPLRFTKYAHRLL